MPFVWYPFYTASTDTTGSQVCIRRGRFRGTRGRVGEHFDAIAFDVLIWGWAVGVGPSGIRRSTLLGVVIEQEPGSKCQNFITLDNPGQQHTLARR